MRDSDVIPGATLRKGGALIPVTCADPWHGTPFAEGRPMTSSSARRIERLAILCAVTVALGVAGGCDSGALPSPDGGAGKGGGAAGAGGRGGAAGGAGGASGAG